MEIKGIQLKLLQLINDQNKLDLLREEKEILTKTIEQIMPMKQQMMPFISLNPNTLKEINKCFNKNTATLEWQVDGNRQRTNHNYAARLKFCARIYSNLNEKLLVELETLKKQMANSQSQMNAFITPKEEINQMEAKSRNYDNQIMKIEMRNPWLKDTEFTLPNIMTEVHKLENLTKQRNNLINELDGFKGLKPDINEARLQLNLIKIQYENIKN